MNQTDQHQTWAQRCLNFEWIWLILWPTIGLLLWITSPRISTLLHDDDTGVLPDHLPSQKAQAQLDEEFPEYSHGARIVVVADRPGGLTANDKMAWQRLALNLQAEQSTMQWQVRAAGISPWLAPLLETMETSVILLELPAGPLTHHSINRVREVKAHVQAVELPKDLRIEVTGSAALGELLDSHAKRDVDMTTFWAFAAVMGILLIVYRSPVAMLLPILTIGAALMVSLGGLGWLASLGFPVNGLVEMFIVVIIVGSGVDYCLFLFSRFREELECESAMRPAIVTALRSTGPAIAAGAGTNALAMMTLILAVNRDLYTSGPTIAGAILLCLAAVLTLAPALLARIGRKLFWPRSIGHIGRTSTFWSSVGRWVTRFPALSAILLVLLLLPPVIVALRAQPLFNSLEEFPEDSSFVKGARLYYERFFDGSEVSELTLLIPLKPDLDPSSLDRGFSALFKGCTDADMPTLFQRDLTYPLGRIEGGETNELYSMFAGEYFLGESGRWTRVDLGFKESPHSPEAMSRVATIRELAATAFQETTPADSTIHVAGETAEYRDMRHVRKRDFALVAVATSVLIYAVLIWLLRSPVMSLVLVGATLLTYLASYGLTWHVFRWLFDLRGLNWQLDFLVFIIIMSLGQDYNIFVVTRIREEAANADPVTAVRRAVERTGGVVSSCGLIMAATFASLLAARLTVMKQFAVALSLGILIDTFLIRPVLVPSIYCLLSRARSGASKYGPEIPP